MDAEAASPTLPMVAARDRRAGARFMLYKWTMGLTVGIVGLTVYNVIGRLDLRRSTTLLETGIDRAIPLVPWTTWFYEPFYIGIFVIGVLGFRSRLLFNRTLVCVVANGVVGGVFHLLLPAAYPRPVLAPPHPDLSTAFLALVHRIDPPGNVFPSLHVAHGFMIAFLLRRERPTLGAAALVMATLLALSTLTTKQHFVVDIIAGFAMALGCRAWALRDVRQRHSGSA